MNVLDPFEVHSIEVWPLIEFENRSGKDLEAVAFLNALEDGVYKKLLDKSEFHAVLNEKDPPNPTIKIEIPNSIKGKVVSAKVSQLRDHPDIRIARRAATLSKLAQVISERKVQKGLRRTLLAQAKRLQALAQRRFDNSSDISEDDE
jgi:hypothetical protein